MRIGRREAIKLLGAAAAALTGAGPLGRGVARALGGATLGVRSVQPGDAEALRAIMSSCVSDDYSFFGPCGEWPLSWAQEFIERRPDSAVVARDGVAIGFFEIPPMKPAPASQPAAASAAEVAKLALREDNRTTFRVTAAGIRADLLSHEDAVTMFHTVLYHGFRAAQGLGYAQAEGWSPWGRHPWMARKWTDYPGCELCEPVAPNLEGGRNVYVMRWRLDDAIAALAGEAQFDVA